MTTITTTEACARLAPLFAGDRKHGFINSKYVVFEESGCWTTFNPLTDANQAIECLEAWLKGDKHRNAQTHSDSTGHQIELEVEDWADMAFVELAIATHESLNYAICEALLSAEAGESITIGGE
jgi:hypothetical protein